MPHIASLAEIGRACGGISKQAVAKYVASGALLRNSRGEIDIEYGPNRQWLIDRNADLSVFYGKEAAAAKAQSKGQPVSPPPVKGTAGVPVPPDKRRNQHDAPVDPGDPAAGNLRRAMDIQKYLKIKSETALNEIKIQESKNAVFEKRVVQNVVGGIMSEMVNAAMSIPQAIVDNLMNLRITNPDREREEIVHMLQEEYLHEYSRVGAAVKKRMAAMKNEEKQPAPDAPKTAEG